MEYKYRVASLQRRCSVFTKGGWLYCRLQFISMALNILFQCIYATALARQTPFAFWGEAMALLCNPFYTLQNKPTNLARKVYTNTKCGGRYRGQMNVFINRCISSIRRLFLTALLLSVCINLHTPFLNNYTLHTFIKYTVEITIN